MSGFTLSNKAASDVKEIGRYTQKEWGREQRNRYLAILDACFRSLAANPLMGKDCGEIRNGYRKHSTGSHVIFYRQTTNDTIEIVRILHKRMDIEHQLQETPVFPPG